MSDLERLARVEERVEMLAKQLGRLDEDISEHVADLKDFVRGTVNGRIKEIEERNAIVRGIVYAACGMVLTAFFLAVLAMAMGAPLKPPTMPQPYTIPSKGSR